MSLLLISERPVLRDPKSGLLDRHPAYEGWVPVSTRFPGHRLAVVVGMVVAAVVVLGLGL